ncbi:MAG: PE-PGRS family protein [Leadbetterella sp.]|nr:PE-PGRS family protein [Leadbetterella sp.]
MRYLTIILLALSLQSCCWFRDCKDPMPGETLPEFESTPSVTPVNANHLDEVSGMAPSFNFPGHLWLMEDSGAEAGIDLLRTDGTHIRKVSFAGINRDWEDMAIGPGPEAGRNYIYIGETGDNNAVYGDYYIYRFEEPSEGQSSIDTYDTIHFRYPDHVSYDAETVIVDPLSRDIYVITKNQLNVRVYRLPYPQSTTSLNEAEYMGAIQYFLIVSGDVSPDGNEILLKAYNALYYWKRKPGETLYQVLSRAHDLSAPYVIEPQGESVCWDTEARGYYTMSERASEPVTPPLYYYRKK